MHMLFSQASLFQLIYFEDLKDDHSAVHAFFDILKLVLLHHLLDSTLMEIHIIWSYMTDNYNYGDW